MPVSCIVRSFWHNYSDISHPLNVCVILIVFLLPDNSDVVMYADAVQSVFELRRHASYRSGLRLLLSGVSARTAALSDMHSSCACSTNVLQALLFVVE